MGFDLGVWKSSHPISDHEAQECYSALCEETLGNNPELAMLVEISSDTEDFAKELVTKYPSLSDVPDDKLDQCPWKCGIEPNPRFIFLCMHSDCAMKVLDDIIELARKYELTCFDPQSGTIAE